MRVQLSFLSFAYSCPFACKPSEGQCLDACPLSVSSLSKVHDLQVVSKSVKEEINEASEDAPASLHHAFTWLEPWISNNEQNQEEQPKHGATDSFKKGPRNTISPL